MQDLSLARKSSCCAGQAFMALHKCWESRALYQPVSASVRVELIRTTHAADIPECPGYKANGDTSSKLDHCLAGTSGRWP